jgi:hypothetical protein
VDDVVEGKLDRALDGERDLDSPLAAPLPDVRASRGQVVELVVTEVRRAVTAASSPSAAKYGSRRPLSVEGYDAARTPCGRRSD